VFLLLEEWENIESNETEAKSEKAGDREHMRRDVCTQPHLVYIPSLTLEQE
jgi:hypothetical protein